MFQNLKFQITYIGGKKKSIQNKEGKRERERGSEKGNLRPLF